jgi:hypothetical protein
MGCAARMSAHDDDPRTMMTRNRVGLQRWELQMGWGGPQRAATPNFVL